MLGLTLWGMLSFAALFATIVALAIGAAMLGWGADERQPVRARTQRLVKFTGPVAVHTGRNRAAL